MPFLVDFNKEFLDIVKDIMYLSVHIDNPFDRVKVMQWLKRLRAMNENKLDLARMRNEYAHFLRIHLMFSPVFLCAPFKYEPPGINEEIEPLPELLANEMAKKCPDLPKTGPIRPVLMHKTSDGKAFMTVKRIPDGGIFCYLAVAPTAFT